MQPSPNGIPKMNAIIQKGNHADIFYSLPEPCCILQVFFSAALFCLSHPHQQFNFEIIRPKYILSHIKLQRNLLTGSVHPQQTTEFN